MKAALQAVVADQAVSEATREYAISKITLYDCVTNGNCLTLVHYG